MKKETKLYTDRDIYMYMSINTVTEFSGILFTVKVPKHHHITEIEHKRQVHKYFSTPDWVLFVKHRE